MPLYLHSVGLGLPGKKQQQKKHFHFLQKDDEDKQEDGSDSSHKTFYKLVLRLV